MVMTALPVLTGSSKLPENVVGGGEPKLVTGLGEVERRLQIVSRADVSHFRRRQTW